MSEAVSSTLRSQYPDVFFFIDRGECGLMYSGQFREFHLSVGPRTKAMQRLNFCPFSGAQFPPSLRDAFFSELEKLGLTRGLFDIDQAPEDFRSEAWWIARGL